MDDAVSETDFARVLKAARAIRRAQPGATRFFCADEAVKTVLADRLTIVDGTVPPRSIPLYYSLVARVEAAL